MNTLSKFTPVLDKFAVSTSAICAIHCLFLPLILVVFPALGATLFGQEFFHVLLLWMIIPLSFVALSMGCRKHKSWMVVLFGLTGLTLLVAAATLGHDLLSETGERITTLFGAVFIAFGHMRNYTLCRRTECVD